MGSKMLLKFFHMDPISTADGANITIVTIYFVVDRLLVYEGNVIDNVPIH